MKKQSIYSRLELLQFTKTPLLIQLTSAVYNSKNIILNFRNKAAPKTYIKAIGISSNKILQQSQIMLFLTGTHFRQIGANWFPGVNDDGSIGEGVGHTLQIRILQGGCQVGGFWFSWVNYNSSIWQRV